MRFSQAWAKLATENQIFKVASAVLACAVIILAISTAKLSLRGAMLIERADTLHLLHSGESEPSENELRDFITHDVISGINYPVSVGLKSKSRSSNNLYGLILTHVEPIKKQEGKK